jgi:hypothetical protein
MNTDLMRQVAAAIELEPERFDMTQWLYVQPQNLCGSAGCVAGTTVLMDPQWCEKHQAFTYREGQQIACYDFDDAELHEHAAEMLDIEWDPGDTSPLFVSTEWWRQASNHLGLPGPTLQQRRDMSLAWITAKHAATVLYALADGTITIEQFHHDE